MRQDIKAVGDLRKTPKGRLTKQLEWNVHFTSVNDTQMETGCQFFHSLPTRIYQCDMIRETVVLESSFPVQEFRPCLNRSCVLFRMHYQSR